MADSNATTLSAAPDPDSPFASPFFKISLLGLFVGEFSQYGYLAVGLCAIAWIVARRPSWIWPLSLVYAPIVLLVLQGIAFGFDAHANKRDILRDCYHFGLFALAFAGGLGAYLGGLTFRGLIVAMACELTVRFGIFGLQIIGNAGSLGRFSSVDSLRDALGQTSTVIATLVLPSLMLLPVWLRYFFVGATVLNFASLSRSHLVTVAAMMTARGMGVMRWVMIIGACIGAGYLITKPTSSLLYESFMRKLNASVRESGDSTFYGLEDINAKWRAYERYIVSTNIAASSTYQQVLGQGFGAMVESHVPKREDRTSAEYTREIPVFHDSTLSVRLKVGYWGTAVWAAWWAFALACVIRGFSDLCRDPWQRWGHVTSFVVVLGLSTFFYGYPLLNRVDMLLFVLGYLICHSLELSRRRRSAQRPWLAAGHSGHLGHSA